MEAFAHFMVDEIQEKLPTGQTLTNIAGKTDRYVLFKVGPVLICSVSNIVLNSLYIDIL